MLLCYCVIKSFCKYSDNYMLLSKLAKVRLMTIVNSDNDLELMAHLIRRAGFGANRKEIERRLLIGYEETVEELINPSNTTSVDPHEFIRYYPMWWKPGTMGGLGQAPWVWTMINTESPLQEKMCLFYHNIFATGVAKVDHYDEIQDMIDFFRQYGLGYYKDILMRVAKSPAMIYWLDNNENHADAINENWGRELLELFTMGVGNYTENDVIECSRAFTGWTLEHKLPRFHMGRWDWKFKFDESDHDYGQKTFLGQVGNFDGEEIIDIILSKPETASFLARHICNFFVADEPQVPAWSVIPPIDQKAIDFVSDLLIQTNYHMGITLRNLFNSSFFKDSLFKRVKNPTEVVVGTLRMLSSSYIPSPDIMDWTSEITNMGQDLMNPPSVEGWHSGTEWINSGTLMKRTNFMAGLIGEKKYSGVTDILDVLKNKKRTPVEVVELCLDIMGPLKVSNKTKTELVDHVAIEGEIQWNRTNEFPVTESKIIELLQLIVSTKEYQFC